MQKGTPKGAYPGLTVRPETGLFQFKLDLPKDVRGTFGKRFIVVSLGTSDHRTAVEKWAPLHAEWREKVRSARSGTLRSIDDHVAQEAAEFLIDRVEHDSPSRYGDDRLTLAKITQFVLEDLDQHEEFTNLDGHRHRLDKLTEADRQAVVTAALEQLFSRLIGRADRKHVEAKIASDRAREIRPETSTTIGPRRLMDAYETWKANKIADGKPAKSKSAGDFKKSCEDFIKVNGDLPLTELTEDHFVQFKDHLYSLKSTKSGELLDQDTRNKKMGGVKAVIKGAIKNRDIKIDPSANVTVPKGKKSTARNDGLFDDEIQLLFTSPVFTEGFRPKGIGEAAYWVPVLAFFTGARQSELCQLTVSDVVKRDGVHCLKIIEDESEGKSIKTESSRRLIPLADRVIELGFLDYVKTLDPKGKLFPDVKADVHGVAGGLFSKWYGKYRREHGLDRKWADFHAIRHLAKTALRGVNGSDEVKLGITGHSSGTESSHYGNYSPAAMKKIVDQLAYKAAVIPVWKPGITRDFRNG